MKARSVTSVTEARVLSVAFLDEIPSFTHDYSYSDYDVSISLTPQDLVAIPMGKTVVVLGDFMRHYTCSVEELQENCVVYTCACSEYGKVSTKV